MTELLRCANDIRGKFEEVERIQQVGCTFATPATGEFPFFPNRLS
jgi:hypothetical protein